MKSSGIQQKEMIKMEIVFTEYVHPHGRVMLINFLVPENKENEVKQLLKLNYEFSCEKLSTGDAILYSNLKGYVDETTITRLILLGDKKYTKQEIIDKLMDGFSCLIDETIKIVDEHKKFIVE